MKRILLIFIIIFTALSGCSQNRLTEKEFAVIWQEYLRREFEESFDEKQSHSQREKILAEILSENNINPEEFKIFMKNNHSNKYKTIFSQ